MWDAPVGLKYGGPEAPPPPEPVKKSLNLPVERLSATSINSFISCPEQFRQKYVLGKREKMYGARFMGSIDHETVEEVIRRKVAGVAVENLTGLYNETWAKKLDEDGEPDWLDDDPIEMHARGLAMVHTYVEQVVSTLKPVEVERKVLYDIEGIGVPLVGYIDVICVNTDTGELYVRERKTTAAKQAKPKSRWRFQGRLYQMMTGLPVQWDVVTRQVTPKVYTAEMEGCEALSLRGTDPKVTEGMVMGAALRMSYLMDKFGADYPWPLDGYFSDWGCDYCTIGPRAASTCGAWNDKRTG